jgi:hypothetical protein
MGKSLTTSAFRQYVKLAEELLRRRKKGKVTDAVEQRFEEAIDKCRAGMSPQELAFLDTKAREVMIRENAESFTLDTSKSPYGVMCPLCQAYALSPCMSKPREKFPGLKFPRFPKGARVRRQPHAERQELYDDTPSHLRVRAM